MAFSLFNPNRPSTLVSILLLIIFHASFYQPSHTFSGYGREITEDGSTRRLFGSKGSTQLPKNCEVLLVHSQCSQNPKCSWCTSEDLEDMCFTKSEAWRLRHQSNDSMKSSRHLSEVVLLNSPMSLQKNGC